MRVRTVVGSDRDNFLELLVRDLIKHEIGYVQLGNEFHFLDYSYRFYSVEEC